MLLPRTKIRLQVKPALLPAELELQSTADEIQWRHVGQDDWQTLVSIDDLNASVTIGTVETLPPGDPATVVNVGTAQDVVLNFALPAGEDGTDGSDGIMSSVQAGTNITIDNTDPANPIINASSGGLTDGDKGDIVVSSSGTVLTIDTGVVSTSKMGGDVTAAGKALLDDADASAQRTTLGLGSGDTPTFNALNVGNADTTLGRGAAGFLTVEGKRIPSPASQVSGDTLYRGATEWERLAKGTASQIYRMNAGATAPEWATAAWTVADLAASAVVTEADGIASNDNDTTIPTSAAVKAFVESSGGTSYFDSQQPTTNVQSVTSTGLSACRAVRGHFAFSNVASGASSYLLQARVSGGSWRTLVSAPFPSDSTSVIAGSFSILNFNQTAEKVAEIKLLHDIADVLDSSDAIREITNGAPLFEGFVFAAYDEVWDEIRIYNNDSAKIGGSTADQRGRWLVTGS